MKSSLSIISILFLALAACSQEREFEISGLAYDISLEELAEFSPEGVGEEVRVRASIELDGETLVLSNDSEVVRVDVSPTTAEVLECVSENELAFGQVSLYFNSRLVGVVIIALVALDAQNPDQIPDFSDILCADIVAINTIARNAHEAGLFPEE